MVKDVVGIAGRVAGQTGIAFISIPTYSCVFIIGFRISMAAGTAEFSKIGGIGVALHAGAPLAFVRSTENGEVLPIMVER